MGLGKAGERAQRLTQNGLAHSREVLPVLLLFMPLHPGLVRMPLCVLPLPHLLRVLPVLRVLRAALGPLRVEGVNGVGGGVGGELGEGHHAAALGAGVLRRGRAMREVEQ